MSTQLPSEGCDASGVRLLGLSRLPVRLLSLSVELALLLMSMPVPSEHLSSRSSRVGFLALWCCHRSLVLSCWVDASIALPHRRGSPMSMPLPSERLSSHLILRVEFSTSPELVTAASGCLGSLCLPARCSPYGRASIAPLTIEGHL